MKISIIGMGYVGLPLALMLSKNYHVIGFDINSIRVKNLLKNYDFNEQHSSNDIKKFNNNNLFIFDESKLNDSRFLLLPFQLLLK